MTDLELITDNFETTMAREPNMTERLYKLFFARHPELRELFGDQSFPTQRQMLQETLVGVIDHLADESWLATNLKILGDKHVEYEVTPEMYVLWTDCLIDVLEDINAEDWSAQLELVWRREIEHVCELMCPDLRASDSGNAAPPTSA